MTSLGGFDELHVHRPDGGEVLLVDRLAGAAAFVDVSFQAPHEAEVGSGVNEDLQIHHLAQRGIRERQDALDQDYWLGLNVVGFLATVVDREVVARDIDRRAMLQRVQMLDQ